MSTSEFIYESMAQFIRDSYPNAVIDDCVTQYRSKIELDFLPHPKADADKPFACVLVPGHEFRIVKEF